MYALYIRVAVQGGGLVLHLNIAVFNFQTMHKVRELKLQFPLSSRVFPITVPPLRALREPTVTA